MFRSIDPPSEPSLANSKTPDTVVSWAPVSVMTVTGEPMVRPSSSATPLLMPSSPGSAGGSPSTYDVALSSLGTYEKKSVGEPPVSTTSPSIAMAP